MEGTTGHIPVLLQETIEGLALTEGMTVVDATLGRTGHALAIGHKLEESGVLIGIDADERNIRDAKDLLSPLKSKVILINSNFADIKDVLRKVGIGDGDVDRFLFDLGLNSLQLESSGRGFSFQVDEPLLMTFSGRPNKGALTAETIVNEWSEESLEAILRGFGGEQFSGRIARNIAEKRKSKKISTTFDLVGIIETAVPDFYKHRRIHCATRTFQALRIAVNDEFSALRRAIAGAWTLLANGGRLAVISFHDGEDRIVKKLFADFKKEGGIPVTKKVVTPARGDAAKNPRARSAKLRIIEKREA